MKFKVCKHTVNLNSWNLLRLFPRKFSKIWLKLFWFQNRKSELPIVDWWVNHIWSISMFCCEKAAKYFFLNQSKSVAWATFEFSLSIYIEILSVYTTHSKFKKWILVCVYFLIPNFSACPNKDQSIRLMG